MPKDTRKAHFLIQANYDRTPLTQIEIIKGQWVNGATQESVHTVWKNSDGALDLCIAWTDEQFDANAPAFWYIRVLEAPTPRWSEHQCRAEGRCEDFPQARRTVRERAWTSPVWFLPKPT